MNLNKNPLLCALIVLSLIIISAGCGDTPVEPDNRILTMTMGEGDELISFTFNLGESEPSQKGNRLILKGAITDFTLPFNKLKTILTKEKLGGEAVVNQLEITPDKDKNQSTLVCRYTTRGTGGGMGNIGGSLVVIFNLDKNILKGSKQLTGELPARGKLAYSDTAFKNEATMVNDDMALVGAKSKNYTSLLSNGEKGTLFHGFVVFDPNNPESIGSAYFEFSIFESPYPWILEDQK